MSLSLWLSLAAICAMGAMSPGPSLALVLRHTLGGGRSSGLVVAITHALGVGLYALLTVWGLAAVIEHRPALFRLVTWGGAVYLAWLGIKALRAEAGGLLRTPGRSASLVIAARDGLMVALGNPKLILFFVALLSQFVTPEMTTLERSIIVLTAAVIDGGWYSLVALGLSCSRVLSWLQARAQWINRITGVMLLALAVRVLVG